MASFTTGVGKLEPTLTLFKMHLSVIWEADAIFLLLFICLFSAGKHSNGMQDFSAVVLEYSYSSFVVVKRQLLLEQPWFPTYFVSLNRSLVMLFLTQTF